MNNDLNYTNRGSTGRSVQSGTIFCVASNYALHAKEMGTVVPTEPSIFIKPPQAIIRSGDSIICPAMSNTVHHEVELVVLIKNDCSHVSRSEAYKYIAGYAVGIDVTMRDIQKKAKEAGKPWAIAKGFVTSAPVSDIIPAEEFEDQIPDFDLLLYVNDELRQSGNTSAMQRSVPELIEFLSSVFTLRANDLIFTGTPAGVGAIKSGDILSAELKGYVKLNVNVI